MTREAKPKFTIIEVSTNKMPRHCKFFLRHGGGHGKGKKERFLYSYAPVPDELSAFMFFTWWLEKNIKIKKGGGCRLEGGLKILLDDKIYREYKAYKENTWVDESS